MPEDQEFTTLPEEFEAIGIKDLLEGEKAYTVPWSVWVKMNGSAVINGKFSFDEKPQGTSSMEIVMQKDRVKVNLKSVGNYKFDRSENPPHTGSTEEDYIPVIFSK